LQERETPQGRQTGRGSLRIRGPEGWPVGTGRLLMTPRTLRVTLNGTGFAANYTAACYGLIPHKNGVAIELAGVTSGRLERAEAFAKWRGVTRAYASHAAMLSEVKPDIDNVCCANYAHGRYVCEASQAGVK